MRKLLLLIGLLFLTRPLFAGWVHIGGQNYDFTTTDTTWVSPICRYYNGSFYSVVGSGLANPGTYYISWNGDKDAVQVQCWGAGYSGTSGGNNKGGDGGAGGNYARVNEFFPTPGTSYAMSIGAANSEQPTYFDWDGILGDGLCFAGSASGTLGFYSAWAVGNVEYYGGRGAHGDAGGINNGYGGGGGSSAGSASDGNYTSSQTTITGGSAPTGGWAGANGGAGGVNPGDPGQNGNTPSQYHYGAGGGGGGGSFGTPGTGGSGSDGHITITYDEYIYINNNFNAGKHVIHYFSGGITYF